MLGRSMFLIGRQCVQAFSFLSAYWGQSSYGALLRMCEERSQLVQNE